MANDQYFAEIRDLMSQNSKLNDNNCWKWIGRARSDVDTDKYCKVWFYQLEKDTKVRKQFYCHRLSYFGFNNILNLETGLEISHLCGHKRCVNPSHLVAEFNIVNHERKFCHNNKSCTGLHSPSCIV